MIRLSHPKFQQEHYDIPAKLSEIKLGQWVKLKEINDELEEGTGIRAMNRNAVKWLHEGFDIPMKDIKLIPRNDLLDVYEAQRNMLADEAQFQIEYEKDNYQVPEFVELEGDKYYVPQNIDKRPWGQWQECETFMERFKDNEFAFYPLNMAIWMLKKDEAHGFNVATDDPYYNEKVVKIMDERTEMFRQVTVDIAIRINGFFLLSSQLLRELLKEYFPLMENLDQLMPQQNLTSSLKNMGDLSTLLKQLNPNSTSSLSTSTEIKE